MPRAYSLDLRTRVVGYVDAGHSRHAAAAHFGVSVSFVVNLLRAWRDSGRLGPRPAGGRRHSKLDPHRAFLLGRVAEREDITMPELSAELSVKGTTVDPASISRWFIRKARESWNANRQPSMGLEPHRLVFIDETGTSTKMTRLRGRCLRGQRLKSKAPFGHWKTQTFIAGLRCHGLTAPFVVDRPMNRRIFETYAETVLAPTLAPGDVVILDNLSVHKSQEAEKTIRARGAWLLFLPPYSPDLNPIEMAFAKLKAHLRARAVRTIDALWKAIGDICAMFSPAECRNYFKAAGYGFT